MADINRIQINEIDMTTGVKPESEIDVAYIPGFFYSEDNTKTALEPTLFTNVETFVDTIGEVSIASDDAQLEFETSSNYKTVLKQNQMDIAYVMAKELLTMGFPVVYEGLINTNPTYIKGDETFFNTYKYELFTKSGETYSSIYAGVTSSVTYAKNTYYEKSASGEFTLISSDSAPEDWPATSTASTKYFSKGAYNADTEYYVSNKDAENNHGFITQAFINQFYTKLATSLETLEDIGISNVKYITSGGYPVIGYNNNTVTEAMIKCAKNRGDAYALIDTYDDATRSLEVTNSNSFYHYFNTYVNGKTTIDFSYASCVYPHGVYDLYADFNLSTSAQKTANQNYILPGSFAYLISLAQSIKNNPSWYAVAGVSRGLVPHLKKLNVNNKLTNRIADSYQPFDMLNNSETRCTSINAITEIREYGLCIWGNRTAKSLVEAKVLTATSFLNLRNLICNVKKVAYSAAQRCMFEQNSEILWINFKSMITPTLDKMQTSSGLSGYKLVRISLTADEQANKRGLVKAKIVLYPVYAVERFEISVIISDTQVEVE